MGDLPLFIWILHCHELDGIIDKMAYNDNII
jgi:hypothetical protein